jgi:hypothetical protein
VIRNDEANVLFNVRLSSKIDNGVENVGSIKTNETRPLEDVRFEDDEECSMICLPAYRFEKI